MLSRGRLKIKEATQDLNWSLKRRTVGGWWYGMGTKRNLSIKIYPQYK